MIHRLTLLLLFILALPVAAQREGAFIDEIEDEDGDLVIVMETDWISMRLMPAIGSTVVRFVFRPTQNEILDLTQPKNLKSGGGLLQDNVWEQDWRFQELRGKWYDYEITKRGPEEVQVVFQTQLEGWLESATSGLKSKLLENLIIRRTVTLRQGTPYFLFDVEFINPDTNAKLPLYWAHNASRIGVTSPDHVMRPSELGINTIPLAGGQDFIYNFNHGWSARVHPERKEGIVYLMDYDYLAFLYNCGVTTSEWVYDNVLVLRDRPVQSRIYILPTMGLEQVDHATEYFIAQLKPRRDKDALRLQYKVVSSYRNARKVTLIPEIVFNLLDPEPTRQTLPAVAFSDLGIEPIAREVVYGGQSTDPVLIRTTAFIDLADGTQVKQTWENFHVGDYTLGANIQRDLTTPVAKLEKLPQEPYIPTPAADLTINRTDWNLFAVLGNNSRVLGLEAAMKRIEGARIDVGYHPGFTVPRTGLTDFPYDYDRLFNYRCIVLNNSIFDNARLVGLSILRNYLERGGGLVYGGGENVFGMTPYNRSHPIYEFLPFAAESRIVKQPARLEVTAADHPIFRGIDLNNLPWQYYVQQVTFRDDLPVEPKVLMTVGGQPFIVEYCPVEGQRTMIELALPFGDPAEHPGQTPVHQWSEWPKLYANLIRYAGYGL